MSLPIVILALGLLGLAVSIGLGMAAGRGRAAREIASGLDVVRTMRWKDFSGYVVRSLEHRGFKIADAQRKPGEDGVDYVMERLGRKHLLQIKHGGAFHVNAVPVRRMLTQMAAHNAAGGIVVTSGAFDPTARDAARGHNVTLVDGEALWSQLKDMLPTTLVSEALARADDVERQRRGRTNGAAALSALLTLAGASWVMINQLRGTPHAGEIEVFAADAAATNAAVRASTATTTPNASAPGSATAAANSAAATQAAPTAAASTTQETAVAEPAIEATAPTDATEVAADAANTAPAAPIVELSPQELQQKRDLVAASSLLIPGVVSANWTSKSTMLVTLRVGNDAERASAAQRVCAEILKYPQMRLSRLQLRPFDAPRNDSRATRWHQCR